MSYNQIYNTNPLFSTLMTCLDIPGNLLEQLNAAYNFWGGEINSENFVPFDIFRLNPTWTPEHRNRDTREGIYDLLNQAFSYMYEENYEVRDDRVRACRNYAGRFQGQTVSGRIRARQILEQ